MEDVIKQKSGFNNKSIYYTNTDSLFTHKQNWPSLFEIGFVGKSLVSGKYDYGNSVLFYAWFLAPKIKYCLVIDDFGFNSAKRTFNGYGEEHRLKKLNQFISLSGRKTIFEAFQVIGRNHWKESKHHIENEILWFVMSENL